MRKFVIRLFTVMLSAAILLCSLTGCESNQASNSESDSVSESTSDDESKDSQVNSDNADSSDSQNEQSNSHSEFDFDAAVKNITLFGKKISLPCTVKDLGEEFSLDERSKWVILESVVSSDLYYKNKKIGTVNLSDSDEEQIICLDFGFGLGNEFITDEKLRKPLYESYGWYSDEIEIDFSGLKFNSSSNEIKFCLGEPTEKTDAYFKDYLVYEYLNGYVWVKFYQDMITEFVIGLL